ncbi:MAG TPA: hypothetical protein VLF64_01860 [Candidatus Saccharimonadales bacterium]|nr:hypothetical protein [Candidatus Saccharimonadales bacterium]
MDDTQVTTSSEMQQTPESEPVFGALNGLLTPATGPSATTVKGKTTLTENNGNG